MEQSFFFSSWPIKTISIEDRNYPKDLKKIKNPPKLLYFRGDFPQDKEKLFAIVGTRKCSDYGKTIAFNFAKELSLSNLVIVSGLARGIDTFSHLGVLEGKGRTIAVLGTGLDEKSFYPKENLKIAKKILESGGCLISEYPPGQKGTNFTFPQRNRIISGLSSGVLVIEANKDSGALITANFAKLQGKKVFAIPGSIFWKTSKGCHFLIKNGAKLVEEPAEILQELNIFQEKKAENFDSLTLEEKLILEALKEGPQNIEKIVEKTKIDIQKLLSLLSIFEIEGKIKNLGNDVYCLNL
jgi:DNA processing protein